MAMKKRSKGGDPDILNSGFSLRAQPCNEQKKDNAKMKTGYVRVCAFNATTNARLEDASEVRVARSTGHKKNRPSSIL